MMDRAALLGRDRGVRRGQPHHDRPGLWGGPRHNRWCGAVTVEHAMLTATLTVVIHPAVVKLQRGTEQLRQLAASRPPLVAQAVLAGERPLDVARGAGLGADRACAPRWAGGRQPCAVRAG
jgi:hypothetical protein